VRSLAFAIRTLTRLRVGSTPLEREERSLIWYPLVGALYGAVFVLCSLLPLSAGLRSALIISCSAYLSRGFHLDGLADFADGLGGGWSSERALAIMRDSHTGAFAVIALLATLLVQYSALQSLVEEPLLLLLAPIFARLMIVLGATLLPYARTGEGSAASLVRGTRARHLLAPLAQVVALIALYARLAGPALGLRTAMGFLASLLGAVVVMRMAHKRLGGVTGDVLGAIEVVGESAALVGLLIPLA